jgi:hypothetical protein
MRSGSFRRSHAFAFVAAASVLLAAPAGAATEGGDAAFARTGVFVAGDFPDGFEVASDTGKGHADNIKLAKGVAGCGPYVTLQKAVLPLPQAKSRRFSDDTRSIGNEVDVFPTARAASAALALYAKPSTVGCLENLLEKQARQDPDQQDVDVVVTLERQAISGLGDSSVVYEGQVELTGADGSTQQVGVGTAAVQVGRAVDVVTYTTTGVDLTEILTPAIDASVSRLRAVLARSSA